MHVIVTGAGIAGLATTWFLARRGVRVTLIDQDAIPGQRAASNDDHRLLRHSYATADGYLMMVGHALKAWDLLWEDLGTSHFHRTGVLVMAGRPNDFGDQCIEQYARMGLAHESLTPAQIKERFSELQTSHVARAALQSDGGVLLAARILRGLGAWVASRDVELLPGSRVEKVDLAQATVTLDDGTRREGDRVVVTAGPWAPKLIPELVGEVNAIRQNGVYLNASETVLSTWRSMPSVFDFGNDDGVYAIPPVDGTGLKFGAEHFERVADPDVSRFPEQGEGRRVLDRIRPLLTHPDAYSVSETRINCFSTGKDERYVVRCAERGIVLTGCSGHMFKMGAVVGAGLGAWATGDVTADQLVPWLRGDQTAHELPRAFFKVTS